MVVGPGATVEESGARLLAAVAAISDAAFANRYLVKLEPGSYKVASALVLKPYIDIEGSGERASLIFSDATLPTATVVAASNVVLRHVGISQNGSNTDNETAMSVNNVSGVTLDHVHLQASGGPEAVALDVDGNFSSVTILDSMLDASHYTVAGTAIGYRQDGGFVELKRSVVSVFAGPYLTYGIVHEEGNLNVVDSDVLVRGPGAAGDMRGITVRTGAYLAVRNSYVLASQGAVGSIGIVMDGGAADVDRSTISTNGAYSIVQNGTASIDVATTGLNKDAAYAPGGTYIRCVFTYNTGTQAATLENCD